MIVTITAEQMHRHADIYWPSCAHVWFSVLQFRLEPCEL